MEYAIGIFAVIIASAVILIPLLDMLTQVSRLMHLPFNPGNWTACAEQLAKVASIPDLNLIRREATAGYPVSIEGLGRGISLRHDGVGSMYVLLNLIIALADCMNARSQPQKRSLGRAAHLFSIISSLLGSGLIIISMVLWVRHGVDPLPFTGFGLLALGAGTLAGLWSFRMRRPMISTAMTIARSLQGRHPEIPDQLRRLFVSQVKGPAWFMVRKRDIPDATISHSHPGGT